MATFSGAYEKAFTADTVNPLKIASWPDNSPPQWTAPKAKVGDQLTMLSTMLAGAKSSGTITQQPTAYEGYVDKGLSQDFFEHIIILDRSYPLGIILSIIERPIEIYNAYRNEIHTLNSFTNNTDSGVTIPDLPGLPEDINPQNGIVGTLTVDTAGPPTINGTLVFNFVGLGDFTIPVTGQRAVMIPFIPETPLVERLIFQTDVIPRINGYEQRIALRDTPRQVFDTLYKLTGHDRRAFLSILFDSMGRAAGLPMWHEPTWTTGPIAVDDATINVELTDYADWREDAVGIVWVDSEDFEALEVESFTKHTITFKSPFQNAFPTGAMVMPVRAAYFEKELRGGRLPKNLQSLEIRYSILDNTVDLSDTSAFPTYNSKVHLDEPNWIDGELSESVTNDIKRIDGRVGTFNVLSDWEAARRAHRKAFFSRTRQRLWEVRQLMHAIRGRAISFYIPTFYDDLEPTAGIVDSATTIKFKNIKYTDLVRERVPKGDLQVVLTDGTTIDRQITDSTELSETEEQITVNSAWGTTASLDEIERVSFIEKVRFDSDEILIEHRNANGQARISAPVKAVLE
jgi:hypothetical protein